MKMFFFDVVVETGSLMERFGSALGSIMEAGDLVVLSGSLGAGKTTLTRGLGESLGVRGPITSPTFVVARTHPRGDGGAPLVHVDAYRLGSASEFDDLDIDFAHSIVVVEWGEGMVDGIADSWLEITIDRSARPAPRAGDISAGSDGTTLGHRRDDDEQELYGMWDGRGERRVHLAAFGPRWNRGAEQRLRLAVSDGLTPDTQ